MYTFVGTADNARDAVTKAHDEFNDLVESGTIEVTHLHTALSVETSDGMPWYSFVITIIVR